MFELVRPRTDLAFIILNLLHRPLNFPDKVR